MLQALVFGPAVGGVALLVAAMVLLTRRRPDGSHPPVLMVLGVLMLLVSLGVGACYGVVLLS